MTTTSTNAARAAATLLELGQAGVTGMSLKDLAAAVGDPKPAILRSLSALLEYGFAEQVSRGRYRLGPSIYSLAKGENAVHAEVTKWRPALALLSEKFEQTMFLVRRAGMDIVVLDMQIGTSPIQAISRGVGSRLPMGIGSGSLAIVATLDPEDRKQIIASNANRFAEFSLDAETVTRYVEQAAVRDYSSDVGLIFPDVGGLAVPIRERGQYTASLSLSMTAPRSFFERHDHRELANEIRKVISHVQSGLPLNLI